MIHVKFCKCKGKIGLSVPTNPNSSPTCVVPWVLGPYCTTENPVHPASQNYGPRKKAKPFSTFQESLNMTPTGQQSIRMLGLAMLTMLAWLAW